VDESSAVRYLQRVAAKMSHQAVHHENISSGYQPCVRKIDDVLRAALWEAYGAKCVYDRRPIDSLDDMEVDHVLPRSLWQGDSRLNGILAALGLPRTYDPNSLDNLVPARRGRNRQKGNWIFDLGTIRFFRGVAAQHQAKVEHFCRKYEQDAGTQRTRARLEAMCAANEQLRHGLLTVLGKTHPFPIRDVVTNGRARFSRSHVKLECTLPIGDVRGSVSIQINTLYLHAVQFNFEAIDVLMSLLSGWGTDPQLGQRAFVEGRRRQRADEWIVSLKGATIVLTWPELQQLCEVVDLVAPHFLGALLKREKADGTLRFAQDGWRNVRLLRMKRTLWREIHEFARRHDFARGRTHWHIFDVAGWGHIKIVRRRGAAVLPFDTYVYASSPEREMNGPNVEPEDETYLCWEESLSRLGRWRGPGRRAWTAEKTYHWLAHQLIPEVVRRLKRRGRLKKFEMWRGRNEPLRFFSDSIVDEHVLFNFKTSVEGLALFADAAQLLYINHANEPVRRSVVESALEGVKLLADILPVGDEHLNYIAIKIRGGDGRNIREIVAAGTKTILAGDSFTASDVDHILRCACSIMRDHSGTNVVPAMTLGPVVRAWRELIQAARHEAIRYRSIERLRQPEYL
jgi:5-methylcytosine-specific restriction endonuclease McrA